ncbi:MAG: hypothetical protein NTY38_33595 [Acidobacteria bacterium]|nr:hypothetical protein [Acidobacteriota bacterium]
MAVCAAVLVVPWLVKNVVVVGNPVSPFLNRVFPNANVHVSFEHDYSAQFRMYGLASRSEIPREITVRGEKLTGLFGPLFLLAPVALLALRRKAGRRLLFAALFFALTYAGNIGTRFLIPAMPFLAMSMALALEPWRFVLPLLVMAHAVASWPPVLSRYCAPQAWRLAKIPVAAAMRRIPEETFLIDKLPEYLIARTIERRTAPGTTVYSFGQVAEAYTTRKILVNFQGALNERLMRVIWEPMADDFQPRHARTFRYPAGVYRRLRLVQTMKAEPDIWGITELRVFHKGVELPRGKWKVNARPYPWDARLAIDGSPMTQWRAWEFLAPGQFFEVDLGAAAESDEVRVLTSADHWKVEMRLEGEAADGRRKTLVEKSQLEFVSPPPDLRRLAMEELKANGIQYVLVHEGSFGQEDLRTRAGEWGIEHLERTNGADLYRIR